MVVFGTVPIDERLAAKASWMKMSVEIGKVVYTFQFSYNGFGGYWLLAISKQDGTQVFNDKVVLSLPYWVDDDAFVLLFFDPTGEARDLNAATLGSKVKCGFMELT